MEKRVNKFIARMMQVTVRLAKGDDKTLKPGRSSGFIYKSPSNGKCYVIASGHGIIKDISDYSLIETRIINDGHILLLPVKDWVSRNDKGFDYAYAEFPLSILQNSVSSNTEVDLIFYRHKFIKAVRNGTYGFAVVNDYAEFIKNDDKYVLPSYSCFEVGLKLVDRDINTNYFKPSGEFKGDEYYRGAASGSPIANVEGAITSILVGGDGRTGLLRAFRLDNLILNL